MSTASPPVTSSVSHRLIGQRIGRYEILHLLAVGGMGSVYVGRRAGVGGFERLVAIKVLHPHLAHEEEFIDMFLDEARLAARIRHPNAVATLDIDESAEGYILVMEYVEGISMMGLMKRAAELRKYVPTSVVLSLVRGALEGLSAAHRLQDAEGHALNLVHRDISPHNILVSTDGVARLTDFGIAKAEVNLSTTRTGQVKGKIAYMSPEQVNGEQVEQRSDLFSMGIVLWEALMQRRLFRGATQGETLHQILYGEVLAPSSVRPELAPLDSLVLKALERERSARFQTADEMVAALEAIAPEVGGLASARQVALVLREFVGEKLEADQASIKEALRALREMEADSAPVRHDRKRRSIITLRPPSRARIASRPSGPTVPTVSEASSDRDSASQPLSTSRRVHLWLWAVLVVGMTVGAGGWVWWRRWSATKSVSETSSVPHHDSRRSRDTNAAMPSDASHSDAHAPDAAVIAAPPQASEHAGVTESPVVERAEPSPPPKRTRRISKPRGREGDKGDGIPDNPYRR